MERQRALAKEEIESSLRLSTFCMRRIGFSFDRSKSVKSNLWQTFLFTASILRYFAMNICGVWFYNLTPLGVYFYKKFVGINAPLGTIWSSWYPFDKEQSLAHAMVYCFEIFAGQTCVWIMVCTDLLFSGMASHLVLLLQILGRELESFAAIEKFETAHYQDLLSIIKLHQRLIRYLLEPFVSMSNKLFLGSALIQVGMLCWYGESIIQASTETKCLYRDELYQYIPRYIHIKLAKREIDESLKLSTSCMFLIGFSLKTPADPSTALRIKIVFVATIIGVSLHALSELAFLCVTIANSPRVEYVAPLLHTVGYGILSQSCVWAMICSDLLFSGMASHIVLILEVLQKRLQLLGCAVKSDTENYQDIVDCVKLHQKLISFCHSDWCNLLVWRKYYSR
ncbi:unnamed protein product, partial [Leptidea sinapis]